MKLSADQQLTCAVSFLHNSCQHLCTVLPLGAVEMASKQKHKPKAKQANTGFLTTGVNKLLENQVMEEKCRAETQETRFYPQLSHKSCVMNFGKITPSPLRSQHPSCNANVAASPFPFPFNPQLRGAGSVPDHSRPFMEQEGSKTFDWVSELCVNIIKTYVFLEMFLQTPLFQCFFQKVPPSILSSLLPPPSFTPLHFLLPKTQLK